MVLAMVRRQCDVDGRQYRSRSGRGVPRHRAGGLQSDAPRRCPAGRAIGATAVGRSGAPDASGGASPAVTGRSPARVPSGHAGDAGWRSGDQRRSSRAVLRPGCVDVAHGWRPPMRNGSAYRDFWDGVGERFPDLQGAVSTEYYTGNERRLFAEHFPRLDGLKILKTDLWDEAKNTRILAWASRRG